MDQNSQSKVIAAGFVLIRKDDQPNIRIKIKDCHTQEWRTKEKFETKASRDRRFIELLMNDKILND